MSNIKHSLLALVSAALVCSLAAVQATQLPAADADKLTQNTETENTVSAPEVLKGDGEGEYIDVSAFTTSNQMYIGQNAYVLTEGGSINLRSAADINSEILNVLPIGTTIKIIDIDNDWYKVEVGEYTGFVKADYVTLDYDAVKAVMLATIMYQKGIVTAGVNVRSEANESSVILSPVSEGSNIIILDEIDEAWYKIYFGENYDIGYVSAQYVEVGDMVARSEINALRNKRIASIVKNAKIKTSNGVIDVKLMPNEDSDTIVTLSNGANCKIVSGGSNWTKIIVNATNEIGYVKTANVEEIVVVTPKKSTDTQKSTTNKKTATAQYATSSSGNGSKLVNQAAKYLGVKYVYGGTSPSGFDCSGLVQYCCRQLGVSVNRTSSAQYSNGVAVAKSNLQPGDLVFFSRGGRISHVAIYAGNGMIIHAPHTGSTVRYQSLSNECKYLHYVGARRVM